MNYLQEIETIGAVIKFIEISIAVLEASDKETGLFFLREMVASMERFRDCVMQNPLSYNTYCELDIIDNLGLRDAR